MPLITTTDLPATALLQHYAAMNDYTDCFSTDIDRHVTLADFVYAFYTTALFKCERWVLAAAIARPCSDQDVRALADGQRDGFAAWRVEARAPDQLLLCDYRGLTRSWLMTVTLAAGATRLLFGSAVVHGRGSRQGARFRGMLFRGLLPIHKRYAAALLGAASSALERRAG